MLLTNSFTVSGIVTEISKEDSGGITINLSQDVAGKFTTIFPVYIPAKLCNNERPPITPGDAILIKNALVYEKDQRIRVRIDNLKQIEKSAAVLNDLWISGIITEPDIKSTGGGGTLYVLQDVLGKLPTTFPVYVPAGLMDSIQAMDLKKDDTVLISQGLVYAKDGEIRIKISDPLQVQKIGGIFDLGVELAGEKFI